MPYPALPLISFHIDKVAFGCNGGRVYSDMHSLVPMAEFKSVLVMDDRGDVLSLYCLVTATYTIERFCYRPLLKKRRSELLDFFVDSVIPPPYRNLPPRQQSEVPLWIAKTLKIFTTAVRFRRD
jgi:hypothetical protein